MIVVFIGPSLPLHARTPKPGTRSLRFRPPARQGDVWRALDDGARAIALIDGVFESQPSVWHREILDALSAGVPVVGGASMGALRAAELHSLGMAGVGRIFDWYRTGEILDDAEVALLHAGAEHGFRPLTVPQVNVRWSAAEAVRRGSMRPAEARRLVEASERVFYQDRTPRRLAGIAPAGFRLLDLKARDARAVLAAVTRAKGPVAPERPPSSWARLPRLPYDPRLADEGLRRALLAGTARELGLRATAADLRAAEQRWRAGRGARDRRGLLDETGLRESEVDRLCEELALERLMLDHAPRMLADGPSAAEGLADELRLRGYFRKASKAGRAKSSR